jgi:hypothetical protein
MLTQSLLPTLSIGIFDHLDHAGGSLCQQYSDRLEIASACDHGTPHGLAASPNLFLSAVAQRTRKLRLGPLVMLLNLYHPLRVFEKICMLDQLSGGPARIITADTVLVLQMEVPFAQSLEVARRTKLASGTVVWNLLPVPEQMTPEMMRDVLGSTDYLLVNEHEALDAAATIGAGMSDFEAAARGLAQAGSLICVVTAGALGAIAVTANGARQRASSPVIRPVDTTGAGDTFVGAFTAMLGERAPLQKPWKWGARLPP